MALSDAQREKIALYVRSYLLRTAQTFGHENAVFRASARWTHTLNVLQNLKAILDGERVTSEIRDVCEVAAYFHDVDHYTVQLEYHAERGAETARRYLTKDGYDPDFIQRVSRVILNHHLDLDDDIAIDDQVKRIINTFSLEERMLMDADTLDKIGVSNILQSVLTMGQLDQMLAESARQLTSGWPLQRASVWSAVLTTPTGKTIGAERFAFYEHFLNQISQEIVITDPYPQLTKTQEMARVSSV